MNKKAFVMGVIAGLIAALIGGIALYLSSLYIDRLFGFFIFFTGLISGIAFAGIFSMLGGQIKNNEEWQIFLHFSTILGMIGVIIYYILPYVLSFFSPIFMVLSEHPEFIIFQTSFGIYDIIFIILGGISGRIWGKYSIRQMQTP